MDIQVDIQLQAMVLQNTCLSISERQTFPFSPCFSILTITFEHIGKQVVVGPVDDVALQRLQVYLRRFFRVTPHELADERQGDMLLAGSGCPLVAADI